MGFMGVGLPPYENPTVGGDCEAGITGGGGVPVIDTGDSYSSCGVDGLSYDGWGTGSLRIGVGAGRSGCFEGPPKFTLGEAINIG